MAVDVIAMNANKTNNLLIFDISFFFILSEKLIVITIPILALICFSTSR